MQVMHEETKTDMGNPTRPLHVAIGSWDERRRALEEDILLSSPFEGKWSTYIDNKRMHIPEGLRDLFSSGGVITTGNDHNLLLFGSKHWLAFQRKMSVKDRMNPVLSEENRLIYMNMHRFKTLEDGAWITIPDVLMKYADIDNKVAIAGMIYYAEVHDIGNFIRSQKIDQHFNK